MAVKPQARGRSKSAKQGISGKVAPPKLNESSFRAMMDRSPMAIYIVDDESGDVLYFNETFAGMVSLEREKTGAEARPIKENDLLSAMSGLMVVPEGLPGAWEPGAGQVETIRMRDGRVIICQRPQIVKIDGHVYRRQMFEDITTQKQTVELAEANEKLRIEIGERRRIEASLANSEALYRAVVDDQAELICRFESSGLLTFASASFRAFFGITKIEGFNFVQAMPEAGCARLHQSLKALSPQAPACTLETNLNGRQGTPRWIQWTVRALYDAEDRFSEYQCVGRDITEEKAAIDRMKQHARMESLAIEISRRFVQSDCGDIDREIEYTLGRVGDFAGVERSYMFIFSPDRSTMDKTHEWCARGIAGTIERLSGLDASLFPWWMERLGMFNAVNIPRVSEMPATAVNERKLLESLDVKSAIIMPLKYRGVLIGLLGFSAVRKERWWSEGEIMLMRIAGDMITGALMRKAAELELTDSDELFRMLTEGIQTLVLVYAHGRFIYANRAAARFTGYDTDELPGMSFWEVVHPEMREEVRRRGLARENGQQEPAEYRMKFLCKDRSARWAYVYVSTAGYKNEKAILISGIDITDAQTGSF